MAKKEIVMPTDEITADFLKAVEGCAEFQEAVSIVRKNSEGSIYLIGGFVYRNIVNNLYSTPVTADVDFDFIVQATSPELSLPTGWNAVKNSYGNPKLKGPNYEIDLVLIDNIHSVIRRGLDPTIENFLSGTPLNVQSIVYDVTNNQVMGEIGISAIRTRTVRVNNIIQAQHSAGLKGKTVEELVKTVAESLQFQAVY